MTFNEILNQELQKQNITQRELANRTGLTEVSIGRYCNGQRSPNVNTIVKIANELHVNADYLLGRETSVCVITAQNSRFNKSTTCYRMKNTKRPPLRVVFFIIIYNLICYP